MSLYGTGDVGDYRLLGKDDVLSPGPQVSDVLRSTFRPGKRRSTGGAIEFGDSDRVRT